jgi:hypothetical protein
MNETVQAVKAGIGFLTAWMTASPMHDESESAGVFLPLADAGTGVPPANLLAGVSLVATQAFAELANLTGDTPAHPCRPWRSSSTQAPGSRRTRQDDRLRIGPDRCRLVDAS